MAMGIRGMGVAVVAILVLLVVQVERTGANGIDAARNVDYPGWKLGRQLSSHEDSLDEFLDEPMRRMLAATPIYISYGALNGNRTPCPSAGRSYYSSCQNTGTVTPYRRSCTQITRCARG